MLIVVCINLAFCSCSSRRAKNQNLPDLKPYVISDNQWNSPLLEKMLDYTVYSPDTLASKKPLVVYLKNLPGPQLGEFNDKALINDFLEKEMMVIEVDYQGDPRAVAPDLLPEIDLWHMYAFNSKDYPVDRDCIYILPAGYTIDRNVRICEFENRPAEMDVIYPSGKTPCVPLMVQISYSRQPGMRINPGGAYYIFGLLTTGYAGAIMDYPGGGRAPVI